MADENGSVQLHLSEDEAKSLLGVLDEASDKMRNRQSIPAGLNAGEWHDRIEVCRVVGIALAQLTANIDVSATGTDTR